MINLRNASTVTHSSISVYEVPTYEVVFFFPANYEYAAACLPENPLDDNYCYVQLVGNTTAHVQIHRISDSESFSLPAGEVYQREYDDFPTTGVESKAIRIISDVAIQVLVYKTASYPNWNDVYMVPDQIGARFSYFTVADNHVCVANTNYKHFYLVTSFYDNTFVNITQQDGTTYHLDLPEFGTFVQKTTDNNLLAIGTEILSSKPINVVSGNLHCTVNPSTFYGTYLSSIPESTSLSREYIVPKLISATTDPGCTVTIIATEDDTIAKSDGQVRILDKGEAAIFDYFVTKSIFVNCSKPCLVAQTAKALYNEHGNFMQTMLPETDFMTFAFFTTLDLHPTSFLSLVIKGESPGDDIYLNGTSLGSLDWTAINGYSSAEMLLDHGVYELDSTDDRPFAAYIYQHTEVATGGVGYTILPQGLSWTPPTTPEPTTLPTTPLPSAPLPQHAVRVNGTTYTADGQPMTPQCAVVSVK